MKNSADNRQFKVTSSNIEPCSPINSLITIFWCWRYCKRIKSYSWFTNEINNVASIMTTQNLSFNFYGSNPEVMFTQPNNPNNKSKPKIRRYSFYCQKSNRSASNSFWKFENNKKIKKTKELLLVDQNCL